jgi:hypothetical protein
MYTYLFLHPKQHSPVPGTSVFSWHLLQRKWTWSVHKQNLARLCMDLCFSVITGTWCNTGTHIQESFFWK